MSSSSYPLNKLSLRDNNANEKDDASKPPTRIPGQDKVSLEAVAQAKYLLQSFERVREKRFVFERIIGEGSFGVTTKMKMVEKPTLSLELPPIRRFVMKRSLDDNGMENVRREIKWIRKFQGAIHISQPFYIDKQDPENSLSYLTGPTLLIEWIDNGLLYDFVERVGDWGQSLPNRMLWRLFLCLCRFVVALAWPPQKSRDDPPEIEVLPPTNDKGDRPPKSQIVHGDLHGKNIMIHNFEEREHPIVPMLKLIDFGMARELRDVATIPEAGMKSNTLDIGNTMLALIGGSQHNGSAPMAVTDSTGTAKTIQSFARDLDGLNPAYKAPKEVVARHREKLDNLDADIRNLVVQCCATDPNNRPPIEYLLTEVERNVNAKKSSDYVAKKYGSNETDEGIGKIVNEVMFDAKMQEDDPNNTLPKVPGLPPPSFTSGFGPGPGPPPPPPAPGGGGGGGFGSYMPDGFSAYGAGDYKMPYY